MQYNKTLYTSITLLAKLSFLLTKTELSLYNKLQEVVSILANALQVKRCSLVLYNNARERFEIVAATGMNIPIEQLRDIDPLENSPIIKHVVLNKKPIVVKDEEDMIKLGIKPKKGYKIQSFISVPLISSGKFLGVLNVTETIYEKPFSELEANTITILSDQIATTIENAKLSEEIIKAKVIKEQLKIAREVQFSLIPHKFPNNDNIEAYGFTTPAYDVGGDYFDIVTLSPTEYVFNVSDVSGKGIPASLIMTSFRSYWRAFIHSSNEPKVILDKLNKVLLSDLEKSAIFITSFYGYYNAQKGTLKYGNAAHEFPLFYSYEKNKFEKFYKNNTILGAFSNYTYSSYYKKVKNGDTIIIFSDGITDFKNLKQIDAEQYIQNVFMENKDQPLKNIVTKIKSQLEFYLKGMMHSDDLTLLMVRFK